MFDVAQVASSKDKYEDGDESPVRQEVGDGEDLGATQRKNGKDWKIWKMEDLEVRVSPSVNSKKETKRTDKMYTAMVSHQCTAKPDPILWLQLAWTRPRDAQSPRTGAEVACKKHPWWRKLTWQQVNPSIPKLHKPNQKRLPVEASFLLYVCLWSDPMSSWTSININNSYQHGRTLCDHRCHWLATTTKAETSMRN